MPIVMMRTDNFARLRLLVNLSPQNKLLALCNLQSLLIYKSRWMTRYADGTNSIQNTQHDLGLVIY
jgi:hypothetical protein